jgi:HD-GYP domain-containing protein (c-di-GMP phosphodiesterase class II)
LRPADLLAALSVVTDLGHGQPPDDAMRACLLAMRLAERMDLGADDRRTVYYTTLLRYIGCTAYAHEDALLFGGDEIAARAALTTRDMANPRDVAAFFFTDLAAAASPGRRVRVVAGALPRAARAVNELAASNCEVGAAMARRLGLGSLVQHALLQLYERWDGKGAPHKLRGEQLTLPVRVAHVATLALNVARKSGLEAAVTVVRQRSGAALDPQVAGIFAQYGPALLAETAVDDSWTAVVAAEPLPYRFILDEEIDVVAGAFADMVDLKLPFTRGHSPGVARLSETAAQLLGLSEAEAILVRRAGLFHDLGRVGVPNGIWEKRGALTASEWEQVRLHPYQTERILQRSPVLAPLARVAGMHHERQDGSGYHRQTPGAGIPMTARLLAAVDAYQAMTQERPYRPAFSSANAASQLRAEAVRGRLDPDAAEAVIAAGEGRHAPVRRSRPAGLSPREVEVLGLLARGSSYKDLGRTLHVSPRTAAHHVQHIYDKIGVSTRAAATMFAMEHDLVPQ